MSDDVWQVGDPAPGTKHSTLGALDPLIGTPRREPSDLVEFLRTCIAEDKAVAREVIDYRQSQLAPEYLTKPDFGIGPNVDVMGPDVRIGVDRVLAECEAKRRMVEDFSAVIRHGGEDVAYALAHHPAREDDRVAYWSAIPTAVHVLRLLALPYAARPGYREEWRP